MFIQVNVGVQLGDQSGFYGAQVNFNGNSPSVFTVAFMLSNSLITDQTGGNYTLNFPAYPSLTQEVGSANVTITLPSTPTAITITKNDGTVNVTNYVTQNLAAYTYSIGSQPSKFPKEHLHLTTIDQLNRQINLDPQAKFQLSDNYHMTNNATSPMTSFVLGVPNKATNIVVKDEFGRTLATSTTSSDTTGNVLQANATLIQSLSNGQSTSYHCLTTIYQAQPFKVHNIP